MAWYKKHARITCIPIPKIQHDQQTMANFALVDNLNDSAIQRFSRTKYGRESSQIIEKNRF
jgi:hypothetical protein